MIKDFNDIVDMGCKGADHDMYVRDFKYPLKLPYASKLCHLKNTNRLPMPANNLFGLEFNETRVIFGKQLMTINSLLKASVNLFIFSITPCTYTLHSHANRHIFNV